MSKAWVLSAKQQRNTLSNVKKKKKALVKNVYGHPRKQYWPVLSAEDEDIILNLLKKLVPTYEAVKKSIRTICASVKTMPPCPREESVQSQADTAESYELVVGLRKITVEIETGNLNCLLLANDVEPPSLGYIIGNLAAARNVPFVAVSNLKSCVEQVLGFKSWCVGFTVSSKHFNLICSKVKNIVNNLQQQSGIQQETFLTMENVKQSSSKGTLEENTKNITDLFLYRPDKSKRMFVPESDVSQDNSAEASFLSFSKDATDTAIYHEEFPIKNKNKSDPITKLSVGSLNSKPRYFEKVQLLPLQVKRFQENPNKQKWKKSENRSSEKRQPLVN